MQRIITKILFSCLFAMILFSSCSSSRSSIDVQKAKISEFKREEYVLLDQVTSVDKSFRFWFLFIPIGGKSDQRLYENAYQKAVKMLPKADGLIEPRYEYKKTSVPLILIGFTTKKVTAIGKGYRLKTDEEMKSNKAD